MVDSYLINAIKSVCFFFFLHPKLLSFFDLQKMRFDQKKESSSPECVVGQCRVRVILSEIVAYFSAAR